MLEPGSVNKRGRVANDVKTEYIVSEDAVEGRTMQISSVVQYRVVPEQLNYETTKLHFENLAKRYGKPIIILSLQKDRRAGRLQRDGTRIC
nr:phosphoinositide phosphatase sac2 [Quercus suber]